MSRNYRFLALRNLAMLLLLIFSATACEPVDPVSLQSGKSDKNQLNAAAQGGLQPGHWHNEALEWMMQNRSIEDLAFAPEQMVSDLMLQMNGVNGHPPASDDAIQGLTQFVLQNNLNDPTQEMMDQAFNTVRASGVFSEELMTLTESLYEMGKNNAPEEDLMDLISLIEEQEWEGTDAIAAFHLVDTFHASKAYWEANDPETLTEKKVYVADAVGSLVGYGLSVLGGTTAVLMPWAGYVTGAMFSFIYDALPV